MDLANYNTFLVVDYVCDFVVGLKTFTAQTLNPVELVITTSTEGFNWIRSLAYSSHTPNYLA